jgi:hypothetical protein
MYYAAIGGGTTWGSDYRVGLVTSTNGITWTRYISNPVLDIGPDTNMVVPYAIKVGPTDWIMMYEATGVSTYTGFICGLATSSDDGWTWTKASGPDYYALVPSAGQWDSANVANPKPMKLGDHMYLLGYNGATGSNYKLGIAISFDGMHWHKVAGNPILSGDGDGVGDGYRIEGLQWFKDQFGRNHMDMLYFGGDSIVTKTFRVALATMDIPEPSLPPTATPLSRGAIYQDFTTTQTIVNNVTPGGGSATLDAGYSISLTLDTQALVSATKMLTDGSDLRVVYWNGSGWTELDRVVEDMNTDHTRVWFKTQAAIAGSDDNYYLYYGNPLAGSPPDDWAGVYAVGDDFNDGTLASGLITSTAGGATIVESGGELRINMGTTAAYAAIVTTQIDASRQFALRHRVRYDTGLSSSDMNMASIVQTDTQPVVMVNTPWNASRRLLFYQKQSGVFSMSYIDPGGTGHYWNGSQWVLAVSWAYTGTLGTTYYIAEIVSDGSQFTMTLRDAGGALITQTTPVPWSQVLNNGTQLWLFWGEPYTSHYWVNARSDFFYLRHYVSPEPAVTLGPEDTQPTAVTLYDFHATFSGRAIHVVWETASEIDCLGFNLYRAESLHGPRTRLNAALIPCQAVGGPVGAEYLFDDPNVTPGTTYYYWLEDVGVYGAAVLHGPVSVTSLYAVYLPLVSSQPAP